MHSIANVVRQRSYVGSFQLISRGERAYLPVVESTFVLVNVEVYVSVTSDKVVETEVVIVVVANSDVSLSPLLPEN